jgi:thiamine pyrophosphokinase
MVFNYHITTLSKACFYDAENVHAMLVCVDGGCTYGPARAEYMAYPR